MVQGKAKGGFTTSTFVSEFIRHWQVPAGQLKVSGTHGGESQALPGGAVNLAVQNKGPAAISGNGA